MKKRLMLFITLLAIATVFDPNSLASANALSSEEMAYEEFLYLKQLKEQDPLAYRTQIEAKKAVIRDQWKALESKGPEGMQAFQARDQQGRQKHLEYLKQNHPEHFQKFIQNKIEQIEQLKQKSPEKYQNFIERHPELERNIENFKRRRSLFPSQANPVSELKRAKLPEPFKHRIEGAQPPLPFQETINPLKRSVGEEKELTGERPVSSEMAHQPEESRKAAGFQSAEQPKSETRGRIYPNPIEPRDPERPMNPRPNQGPEQNPFQRRKAEQRRLGQSPEDRFKREAKSVGQTLNREGMKRDFSAARQGQASQGPLKKRQSS